MHSRTTTVLAAFLGAQIAASAALAGGVIYVADDAPLGGDGATWDTAYRFLQDALAAATPGTEIRVAAGTYLPDRSEAMPDGSGSHQDAFDLLSGVALRGGYAGPGEPDPDERDLDAYETCLSGDLAQDDGPDLTNIVDNSWHVLRATSVDDSAVLDGFLVIGGNAAGPEGAPNHDAAGGALNMHNANPLIENCTFRGNHAMGRGGAVVVLLSSDATFVNCTFEENVVDSGSSSPSGGGLAVEDAHVTLEGCTFSDNTARNGAGLMIEQASAEVTDCAFTDNTGANGAGVRVIEAFDVIFSGCTFDGNSVAADANGGGIGGAVANTATLSSYVDCVFTNNTAEITAGALAFGGVPVTVTDCEFIGNSSRRGGAIRANESDAEIVGCLFQGNSAVADGDGVGGQGGAINLITSSPSISGCQFLDNTGTAAGGAIRNDFSNPVITDTLFAGNSGYVGGAVASGNNIEDGPRFERCRFLGNVAETTGGAVNTTFGSATVAISCLFAGNEAGTFGGALSTNDGCTTEIHLSTIVDNTALMGGGVCDSGVDTTVLVTNSIVSGNAASEFDQICDIGGSVSVWSSLVEGGWGGPGGGNISGDPMFADADGPDDDPATWADNDYTLAGGSPCIDAGDSTLVPPGVVLDLCGNDRVVGDDVDMGACEFHHCPGDTNGDRVVDVTDLVNVILDWGTDGSAHGGDVDGTGLVDVSDLVMVIVNWGVCG